MYALAGRLSNGFQIDLVETRSAQLLLVEDTPDLALWLATALRRGGYGVTLAASAAEAERCLPPGHAIDAVLLDIQLPDEDGLTVLQRWRRRGEQVPVMLLTARAAVPDRVLGLNLGADDYLPKPFDLSELEARLAALLRRRGTVGPSLWQLGPLTMRSSTGEVWLAGQLVTLTRREQAVLAALLEQPNRVVTKEALHQQVFGHDESAALDAVEVLVHRLRKKLDMAWLAGQPDAHVHPHAPRVATVRGVGYMLALAPGVSP